MNNIIKFISLNMIFVVSAIANNIGVVNTDILLIKKQPNDQSIKLGFYKMNELIEIENENNEWYKTEKGYVKSEYIIKKSTLPKFLDKSEVDFSKFVIQLIVYNPNVSKGLLDLQKTLIDEENLYLQKTSRAIVAYVVNIDSYSLAKEKLSKIKKHYKTSFISNIKNKSKSKKIVNKVKDKKPFDPKPKKEIVKYNSDINEVVFTPASKSKEYITIKKKVNMEQTVSKPKKVTIITKPKKEVLKFKEKANSSYSKKINYYSDDEFSVLDQNIEDEIGDFDIEKSMSEFDDVPSSKSKYKSKYKNLREFDDVSSPKSKYKSIKKYVPRTVNKKVVRNTSSSVIEKEVPELTVEEIKPNPIVVPKVLIIKEDANIEEVEIKTETPVAVKKEIIVKEEPKVEKNFNSLMESILIGL